MATFRVTGGVLEGEAVPSAPGAPGEPDHIWGGGNEPFPTPPIVLPIPPDGLAPGVPTHPIYLPVYPAHPIVIPPGAIAPGVPTHPIYLPPTIWPKPGHPAHPIVIPPDSISPGVPAHPIVLPPIIWGPTDPFPTPPIYIPAPPTGPGGPDGSDDGKWVYSPVYGWVWDPGEGGKPQPLPPGQAGGENPVGRRG